ncbi:MAG: dTDP-4-dehydrorhamnose reductase [Chloroflexi bacterium]|nr:dTDP-4-dehydrorhamnose reductase [Chloroflexota bacterium]
MKIALFGGKYGQLGWELRRTLAPLGEVIAVDRDDLDLRDASALEGFLREQAPRLIVNASAYTAVDRAEQEQELAFAINERAPRVMAEVARSLGAGLIHYSTDYVFDGNMGRPYVESDATNPLNVYGQSKLAGERAIQETGANHLIFRTAWVFSMRGESFIAKLLEWSRQKPELRVVDDQVSNPTWARMLAEATALLLAGGGEDMPAYIEEKCGIYHLAGWGYTSRFEWAKQILANDPRRTEQRVQAIQPARTDEFPTPATRPLFSALDCSRFEHNFGLRLPPWEEALQRCMEG